MNKIEGGAIIWARQTIESKIFYKKPDKWFKIWFYLVAKVNHTDNERFKRGTCFLKYDWIMNSTGATKDEVKHCIQFLKDSSMLATQKATRGFVVEVLKYKHYQNLKSYKSHTKSHRKATQKPHKSHTINKNGKNGKNGNKELNHAKSAFQAPQNLKKLEKEVEKLVELYKKTFPEHIKVYKGGAIINMRNLISLSISKGIPLEAIRDQIQKSKTGTPWEILDEYWMKEILRPKTPEEIIKYQKKRLGWSPYEQIKKINKK